MMKNYSILLVLCVLGISGYAQDTLNLVPPSNLQADFQNDVVMLSWTAPVDTTASPDTIPQGLIGYNVYSATELIGFTQHSLETFIDSTPDPDAAFYRITALYDLTLYGYPGDTAESVFSGIAFAITGYSYNLPFSEYFLTGLFETNQWVHESDNWRISGQSGNPAPGAEFFYAPPVTDYSISLISTWLGSSYVDGNIYVSFRMKKQIIHPTLTEYLYIDAFNGFEWQQVAAYTNDASIDWLDYDIKLPNEFIFAPFKIRFRAEGQNSLNIVYWQIDNIIVYRECAAPYNLELSIPDPMNHGCLILLEWEHLRTPTCSSQQLQWDNVKSSQSFVSYNIYREDTLYATTTDKFFWDDLNALDHVVNYNVSAVYSDCESGFSNKAYSTWCWESAENNDIPSINIYPNPATDLISISITGDIRKLYFDDLTGRHHAIYIIPQGSSTFVTDISALPKGMYIVRFVTGSGQRGAKKVILN